MKRPGPAAAALAALLSAACGPPLLKLPAGPGQPAPDAWAALDQATAACRAVATLTAVVAVSGSVGGHRVRGRLSAGFAAPAAARLEAAASFGPPAFIFVAERGAATLLLPRDDRVLAGGDPGEVLEAVSGVPLGPAALRRVLTGCPTIDLTGGEGRRAGDDWRIVSRGGETAYLHRDGAAVPWRLAALRHRPGAASSWRAEYREFQTGLPASVRLLREAPRGGGFDLRLSLSQVEIDPALDAGVFRVRVPASARPITIDELRRSGPLALPAGRSADAR